MRGLLVKIFICSVLIQVITHGVWVTMSVLFAAQVPGSARLMRDALPLYVELGRNTLAHDGPDALAALVDRAQRGGNLRLQVRQGAPCTPDVGMGPMAMAAGDADFCMIALPNVRRGLHLWPDGVMLVQLGVCALFSYVLARHLLQPIRVLGVAAEALGRGDLSARAGPRMGRRRDEAGVLVRQFDRMADRIALLIRSQQRFIGDVSHEIKSPLARLTLAVGLARRETGGLADARFDRMEGEIEAIATLIRELLALSSLEAADMADRSRPVDLDAMVRGVIDDAGFEWADRGADIRLTAPEYPVLVPGDATLLRRAFENVLRNALFYTAPGTPVNVVIRNAGPHITLLVQDQGPGVPPEALGHLFDPFYRVDEARARNTGGVGIGLAICARAVRLHGGAVCARNVSPSGLAISLDLPAASPGAPALA